MYINLLKQTTRIKRKPAAKQDYLNILVVLAAMLDPIKRLIRSGACRLEIG